MEGGGHNINGGDKVALPDVEVQLCDVDKTRGLQRLEGGGHSIVGGNKVSPPDAGVQCCDAVRSLPRSTLFLSARFLNMWFMVSRTYCTEEYSAC